MAGTLDPSHTKEQHDFADYSIAAVTGLALTFTMLLLFAIPASANLVGTRDFVSYWATGRQLVNHANPYDRGALQKIEHSAGLFPNGVLLMRNPPWALPLVYPLGFLNARVASVFWTLILIACLVSSVRCIRILHGTPPDLTHWLALSFSPALLCLIMGQTSIFALLGFVLFLRYHRARPFEAGFSLWLCALKPQLFLPFIVVLLAWILVSRSYKIVAGSASAIAISSALAYLIAPSAWRDYLHLMRSPSVQTEFVPCLSDAIRFTIRPQAVWIQYAPAALCCLWALVYFWRRRVSWNWTENSSSLMLASLLTAPYCWFYDQSLAIPAIMHGAYATRLRWMITILALLITLVDVEMCKVKVLSPLYLWNIPVWFAWYLVARFFARQQVPAAAASV